MDRAGGPADATASRDGVTVVVCSRNRPRQLQECLQVVTGALRPQDELVLVDSASDTPETAALTAAVPGATAVRCERPGLSRARNAGLRAATRPVVAFTDDDCAPQRGWLDLLEAEFADPRVGMVTGAVRPHGSGFLSGLTSPRRAVHRYPADGTPMGHGANMAGRRELLLRIGGFDEELGAGAPWRAADDWDVFFRVLRTGALLVYTPRAIVLHHQWRSSREALTTRYGYAVGAGALSVKLRRLGGRHDRAMGRRLARRRVAEGARATVVGLGTLRWFRCAAGLVTLAGYARGAAGARRRELAGEVFAPPPAPAARP